MLSIIVAIDQNNAIGRNNDLLCYLPDDLKHFKQVTTGKPVIMGENTYYSLPKHPLPNRRNIVLTLQDELVDEQGIDLVHSIDEAAESVDKTIENFVIGGGSVYRQFMPLADKLYITHIDHTFEGADTFFPEIDPKVWQEISREFHPKDERHDFAFSYVEYIRRSSNSQ